MEVIRYRHTYLCSFDKDLHVWFVGDVQYVKIRLGFRIYGIFFCKDLSHSCKDLSFLKHKTTSY